MNCKLYVLLACSCSASMVLSACGGAGAASGKKITIAYSQEPDNIRLEYSNMTYSAWMDQIIDASLLTWDENISWSPIWQLKFHPLPMAMFRPMA